jgi:hypothetical protein
MLKEYILEKLKSRQRIEVISDVSDNWLIDITWIEKKTGKIIRSSCIIRKDLETWMRSLQKDGWKIVHHEKLE